MTKSEKGRGKMTTPLRDEFEKVYQKKFGFKLESDGCGEYALFAVRWAMERIQL